eukprot:9554578-Karenia_brevis.AAC.1
MKDLGLSLMRLLTWEIGTKEMAEALRYGRFESGPVLLFSPSLTQWSRFFAIQVKFVTLL